MTQLETLTSDKHSNLLGQFLSYEENEVLWIRTLEPLLDHFLGQYFIHNMLVMTTSLLWSQSATSAQVYYL